MAKDALAAHARDELGISEVTAARPVQAAMISVPGRIDRVFFTGGIGEIMMGKAVVILPDPPPRPRSSSTK